MNIVLILLTGTMVGIFTGLGVNALTDKVDAAVYFGGGVFIFCILFLAILIKK